MYMKPLNYSVKILLSASLLSGFALAAVAGDEDPPEVQVGERLFLETRFAQAYATDPATPDPVLANSVTVDGKLPGPFAGKHMNCRACHLIDEHVQAAGGGMRSYTDFARHSPVPLRKDSHTATPRNSQSLVNIGASPVLHYDGEFATMEDLVKATLTGRNYGWQPSEQSQAIRHIARIIREDDGRGELAREFGGRYADVLAGTDAAVPGKFRLPDAYRLEVKTASDTQILDHAARLIAAYVRNLGFSRDDKGRYNGSPYDVFLAKNKLPRKPADNETIRNYSRRLSDALARLKHPQFVSPTEARFKSHSQDFVFGADELAGMKIFFRRRAQAGSSAGNCIACHAAPDFTDMNFHNTGNSQLGYDSVHGDGAFARLAIPELTARQGNHAAYLPATARHADASGRFRAIPHRAYPDRADLGLWNVFANPDLPGPQEKLRRLLCKPDKMHDCSDAALLPATIGRFRTPTLRDLGHSAPYLHDGSVTALENIVTFYIRVSGLARSNRLRNSDAELAAIHLDGTDIAHLTAFLRALNEDYE